MTPADYEYLRKLLKERSGLDLSADKQYLVESRLVPLARRSNLAGIPELVAKMKSGAEPLIAEVVEAMTTNETFFFRDKVPFDHLKDAVLPALAQARAARRVFADLVRGGLDRAGAVFDRDVPEGSRRHAVGLAHRDRRDRSVDSPCWKKPGPACSASSKCSAACRSRCW